MKQKPVVSLEETDKSIIMVRDFRSPPEAEQVLRNLVRTDRI